MRNYLSLSYEEFFELHNAGKIEIATNKQWAMIVCDSDPRIERPEKFWHEVRKCCALGMLLIGIVLFFFIPWYWALLIFMLGFPAAKGARDKSAEVVARACLKDAGLYYTCVDAGIVRVFALP